MGNSSSKQSGDKAKKAQAKKNLKAADRLQRDRHTNNGFFHREPDFEAIRAKAVGRAQASHRPNISAPMPGHFPHVQTPPPIYHYNVSDRRPPTPPPQRQIREKVRERFARPMSVVDAVPPPLTLRKQPLNVPSTGRQMPSAGGPSSLEEQFRYRPASTSRPTDSRPAHSRPTDSRPAHSRPTRSALTRARTNSSETLPAPPIPLRSESRRQRPQAPERQRQPQPREPARAPAPRLPQPPSSRRYGPSSARIPPSSDRAPLPPSGPHYAPRGEASRTEAPVRSGRRRVTREDIRRRGRE